MNVIKNGWNAILDLEMDYTTLVKNFTGLILYGPYKWNVCWDTFGCKLVMIQPLGMISQSKIYIFE